MIMRVHVRMKANHVMCTRNLCILHDYIIMVIRHRLEAKPVTWTCNSCIFHDLHEFAYTRS